MWMCCTFDFKTRNRWALVVIILSAVVAIGGIVMVGLSVKFYTSEDEFWSADMGDMNEEMDSIRNGVFGALLVFSIVAVIVGGFGMSCLCGPCKPDATCARAWPITYGIILSVVWIVYFVVGGIVTGMATQLPEAIQQSCGGETMDELKDLDEAI